MPDDRSSRWRLTFTDGSSEEIEADRIVRTGAVPGQVAIYEWYTGSDQHTGQRLVCTLEGVAKLERLARDRLF